jgi:hypothetical protein
MYNIHYTYYKMSESLPVPLVVVGTTKEVLENGIINLNGLTLTATNLTPNMPLKTDLNSKIYSTLLTPNDIVGFNITDFVEKTTIIQQNINSKLTAPTFGTTNHNDVDILLTTHDTDISTNKTDLANFISTKGTSNGLCPLVSGVIPDTYIPQIAITPPNVYASIAVRDADIANVQTGDIAIVIDVEKSYIYDGSSYIELIATGSISSINGKTGGAVVIDTDEITEVGDSRYYTAARDALKVDLAGDIMTGKLTTTTVGTTNHNDVDAELTTIANFIATKGVPNGLCPLNANSVIDNVFIPPLAITKPIVYASIAARDADVANVEMGDVAIVTDVNKSYIYGSSSYVELITTGSISSINGKSGGSITIDTDEITEVGDSRYYTAARDALKADVSSLNSISTTLQTNIDNEASTRSTNDNTLQTNLDTEASTRSTNDDTLQTNIDAVQTNLDTEESTRSTNDDTLQTNIDTVQTNIDAVQTNLDTEESTRSTNDDTLQTNIDTVQTNIDTVQTNLDTEASTRLASDGTLQTNINTVQTNIDTVQTNLDTEASTRLASDGTLQTNINTEASTRSTNDGTLQTNIDAVQTNLDTEASTRSTNDGTLQTNINTEASTRSTNDGTLQTNIDAVQTNLDTEASTRSTNDGTLQTNINTVQTNIDTEASTRSTNDGTINSRLDNLTTPNYTNTQRNALTQVSGMVIYNTTAKTLEITDGFNWQAMLSQSQYKELTTPDDLTSFTSDPGFTITQSSVFGDGSAFPGWQAFSSTAGSWLSGGSTYNTGSGVATSNDTFGGVNGSWLKISLDHPKGLTKYKIMPPNTTRVPVQWRVLTSIDDITYSVVSTQSTDYTFTNGVSVYSADFLLPEPVVAQYIVIQITKRTSGSGNEGVDIEQLDFSGADKLGPVKLHDYTFDQTSSGILIATHNDGGTVIVGQPLINASSSRSTFHTDFNTMLPIDMLASITTTGGINKYWGRSETYVADVDLLAGRIASLADQPQGTDNANALRVGYLKVGGSVVPGVTPMGVTQHNCLAGEPILLCVHGYTTAISKVAIAHSRRGSVVLGGDDVDNGKIRIGAAGAAVQARIGFVAQSNSVSIGDPVLIHYSGYYQAT